MSSNASPGKPESKSFRVLRVAAVDALMTGAAVSLALMLRAGRRQNSLILLLLFGIWVLTPFIAALWVHLVSKHWPVATRAMLYVVMLVLTVGSLIVYGNAVFGRPKAKIGFIFLVVPFASWLLITIPVAVAAIKLRHADIPK